MADPTGEGATRGEGSRRSPSARLRAASGRPVVSPLHAAPPDRDPADARTDQRIETELAGWPCHFVTTFGLFSPREIDAGTRLLVAQLAPEPDDDCLDLGCGYGPIGCYLAARAPRGRTLMVDRDFVAVDYALRNAAANGLTNADAMLSNGLAQVGDRRFDLIASNLPAKVGRELYTIFLEDAWSHLKPGGCFQAVLIRQLWPALRREAERVFGQVEKQREGPKHIVFRARRSGL